MVTITEINKLIEATTEELEIGKFGIGLDEMGGAPGERLKGLREQLKELTSGKAEETWEIDKSGGLGNWKIK